VELPLAKGFLPRVRGTEGVLKTIERRDSKDSFFDGKEGFCPLRGERERMSEELLQKKRELDQLKTTPYPHEESKIE
jgi:hypothetical protein